MTRMPYPEAREVTDILLAFVDAAIKVWSEVSDVGKWKLSPERRLLREDMERCLSDGFGRRQ